MKVASLCFAVAGSFVAAQSVFTPYDCYEESEEVFGSREGKKVTDIVDITGLSAFDSKLAALSLCEDQSRNLVSGIVTVWGNWDETTRDWKDLKRLNAIGRMSGLYEFDDYKALAAAGLPPIQPGQDLPLQKYWY